MMAGGAAGGIASFIANPTDLLKTRMQADAGRCHARWSRTSRTLPRRAASPAFWRRLDDGGARGDTRRSQDGEL